jgi:hypothetical protein
MPVERVSTPMSLLDREEHDGYAFADRCELPSDISLHEHDEPGGSGVRVGFCLILLVAVMMLVPLNAAASTVVNLSDLNISIEIPTGWTYERNASSGGITYDLQVQGPSSGGFRPFGLMAHEDWPGTVSDSTLWAQMKKDLGDIRAESGISSVIVVSPATNITINGVKGCDMILTLMTSGVLVEEREVILASSSWHMAWSLVVAVVGSQWNSYSSNVNSMVNSLTVNERAAAELPTSLMIGILVGVVAVVVVIVLVVMRGKKKAALIPPQMPPLQPCIQPPLQPPVQPPAPPSAGP